MIRKLNFHWFLGSLGTVTKIDKNKFGYLSPHFPSMNQIFKLDKVNFHSNSVGIKDLNSAWISRI